MRMVLRRAECRDAASEESFRSREGGQDKIRVKITLHEAVRRKNLGLVRRVAETANVNEPDVDGKTPLMVAAEIDDNVIGTFLMSKGASMYSIDNEGKNAIEIASENHSFGMLALFDHARGWHLLD